jgi:hypothetical protein
MGPHYFFQFSFFVAFLKYKHSLLKIAIFLPPAAGIAAGFLAPILGQTAPSHADNAGKSFAPLPIPENPS